VDDELCSAATCRRSSRGSGSSVPGFPLARPLPLSEVEELREFGEVVWERSDELGELDPLDFHFTHEPIAVTPEVQSVFVELVREAAPAVALVYVSHARFWKANANSTVKPPSSSAGMSRVTARPTR
jgi:hypothetical protein